MIIGFDATMLFRISFAAACVLLGFAFFPMFLVGALIAWSIVQDIREAPERRALDAELDKLARAPVSAQDLRDACESPAEVAFLDAMIEAYGLKSGEGALEGSGLRLTSQKGMGAFHVFRQSASHQYRADFLVDENLVVEIDGAAFHSTPEAIARDRKRDADLAREGYLTLRIPARDVFQTPSKAVAAVEKAREALRKGRPDHAECTIAASTCRATPEVRRPFLSRVNEALGELDDRSKRFHAAAAIEGAISAMLNDIEAIVVNASEVSALTASPTTASEAERREANGIWLRKMVEAINAEPRTPNVKQVACSKAVDAMSRCDARETCERAIEHSVEDHMSKLKAAHNTLFPELDAFPDDMFTGMSQRDTLIKELRSIFFEGADPAKFYHPYMPPAKGAVLFASWWREEVAGRNPVTRSLLNTIAALEVQRKSTSSTPGA